jgi:type IV pilus modification protein PilV
MNGSGTDRARQGFSLLEVLVALSILAVGLLGLALFQITAIKGNASANDTVLATNYAQDGIETLQATPFDNVADSPLGIVGGAPDNNTANIRSITASNQTYLSKKNVRFYRVWSVTPPIATTVPAPSFVTIRIWAFWWDDKNMVHRVELVTQRGNVL